VGADKRQRRDGGGDTDTKHASLHPDPPTHFAHSLMFVTAMSTLSRC
jgi:hypothetical protein